MADSLTPQLKKFSFKVSTKVKLLLIGRLKGISIVFFISISSVLDRNDRLVILISYPDPVDPQSVIFTLA